MKKGVQKKCMVSLHHFKEQKRFSDTSLELPEIHLKKNLSGILPHILELQEELPLSLATEVTTEVAEEMLDVDSTIKEAPVLNIYISYIPDEEMCLLLATKTTLSTVF